MDVFGKGLEHRPLDPPGVCFLCETSPIQHDTRIINTNRHFHPGGPTHLTGRKYVCEPCAVELGQLIGMVPGEELDAAQEKLEKNSVFIHELVAKVSDLEQFHELADRLIPKPAPAPKKKPENRPYDTDRSKAQAAAKDS